MKQLLQEWLFIIVFAILLAMVAFTFGMETAKAETKIAVIDTGFDMQYKDKVKLCDSGHRDFTGTGLQDNHGHGTHIAGLIAENAQDYCIMVLKYYTPKTGTNLASSILAIEWAILQGADIINYSGGGLEPSGREKQSVLKALNAGIIFVAASGNEWSNLAKKPYYPAMYDKRIIVVGNLTEDGQRAPSSNYGGPTDLMVRGTKVRSINGTMTGTSQSTAIVTGRVAKQLYTRKILSQQVELFGPVTTDKYLFEYQIYMAR